MKIASWNVNSLRARLIHVLDWLVTAEPDVLGLQETKLTDDNFPVADFESLGYRCAFSGQPAYNGVAILSRLPITDVVTDLDDIDDPQRRVLGATIGSLRVLNLYVPNGQSVGSDKYQYKLGWLAALLRQLEGELARHERVAVLGDFNIAPENRDVHDPVAWEGKVLCSAKERAALAEILALGFADTYRLFDQPERGFSWWDYRAAAFRRNRGLRIDLILASAALSRDCIRSTIDVAPRKRERPSDHAPVYAEFDIGA
ncbi:MAG TPA: exodeoxyribonuclease III [Gammaproteobacteria bacterium]|nr:exodeoxyribonuclease III [Gammaproteobacteria bacterium]